MVTELYAGPCVALEIQQKDPIKTFREFCGPADPVSSGQMQNMFFPLTQYFIFEPHLTLLKLYPQEIGKSFILKRSSWGLERWYREKDTWQAQIQFLVSQMVP